MAADTTSVGVISFDLGVNTASLNQSIAAASQQISASLTSSFQNAVSACENSMNGLAGSLTQTASGMTSALQGSMNSLADSFTQTANSMTSAIQSSFGQGTQHIADSVSRMAEDIQHGLSQASQSISQTVQNESAQLGASAEDAEKKVNTLIPAVKKLGATILKAFAIKQVAAFARSCVEAAAKVKALNAQLVQTFNVLETDARNAIKKVADESGILETRLQGVGTQIYAFAKASGMDSVTALNMMQEALQVTADSAAYYDRSIEDVSESLRSFLKGNYANDAALGISCTEATRNAAANKLYGKSFMELSEAQKQLTLLQMVKDANELSGAMGQAAREADGWENVTGNLKEAWKQFKAAIGQPLLQALIPIIKNITSALQAMTEAASEAARTLAELFGWELNEEAESTGGAISDIAENVSEAEEEAQEDIEATAKAKQKAQNYLAGFDEMNVVKSSDSDEEDEDTDKKGTEAAKELELARESADELKKSIDSIKLDSLKQRILDAVGFLEPLFSSIQRNIKASSDIAKKSIEKYLDEYGGSISTYADRIKENLENTAVQTANGLSNILNEAAASKERCSEELSQGYADMLGGASIFALSFADVFTDGLDIASKNFEDWTVENSDSLGNFFDGINLNAANAMSTFGGIFEDIGTTLTDWWDNTGSVSFDNLTKALLDVQTVLLDFWSSYISPFVDYVIDSFGELWDKHLSPLWKGILDLVSSLMDTVTALWNGFLRPLYDTFIKRLMTGVIGALKSVWDVIVDVFGMIADIVRGVIRSAQGLLDFITGIFTGDLEKAFLGFAEFVQGICTAIWGIIKGVINVIIDGLNALWSGLYGAIKSIVDGIGDLFSVIGDVLGRNWGFSLPDEAPRIPRLAAGGLVKAPTLAMVGDNRNAAADPEVIAPLSKLEGMMNGGDTARTIELLQEIVQLLRGLDLTFVGQVDKTVLFEFTRRTAAEYERKTGVKPF